MLYCTADQIGSKTGGGLVTDQEVSALSQLGSYQVWDKNTWEGDSKVVGMYPPDPWTWDFLASKRLDEWKEKYKLAAFYSSTFSSTVRKLRDAGTKVSYTCAAHRVSDSKKAHESLGIPYNLPHLTERDQWEKYSRGYWDSDILVVPSQHSKTVVMEQMDDLNIKERPRVEVIPHGCDIQKECISQLPGMFTLGYLGAVGPDKGLRYLLEAWDMLNYKDAILILAGKDSTSPFAKLLVGAYGGGSIYLAGWQDKVSDFYSQISLYCQPSATEGFGLEVLEAMAHGRAALCSDHAGAVDVVHPSWVFPASNSKALAEKIDEAKKTWDLMTRGEWGKEQAKKYSWEIIRNRYREVWRSLLK